jgi:extradiol dioxygenase family protein
MSDVAPFHLAFPVHDLAATRHFYGEVLGCAEGRSSADWIDFQSLRAPDRGPPGATQGAGDEHHNLVDGHGVPVPHFGVVLAWAEFEPFAQRLRAKGVQFVIEPYIRFAGQVGEQATMFFRDPSGNALEFKAFQDRGQLFAK